MKSTPIQLVCIAIMLCLVTSCAIRTPLQTNAKLRPIEQEGIPELKEGQIVGILNYYSEPEIVELGSGVGMAIGIVAVGDDAYKLDLKQFTATSMVLLSNALTSRNIVVKFGETGPKEVKLRVHEIVYELGAFSADTGVSVTAELGNGKSINVSEKIEGDLVTRLNVAMTAAVSGATRQVLNHSDFIKYVNQ